MVAPGGDIAVEGTKDPSLGRVTEAYGDATTTVAAVNTSSGGDKVLEATSGDVTMEGTAQPGATNCSWDTLGRIPEVPGDATTTVASVPVSSGSDKVLEATSGDVTMEGTEDPSVTSDPRDTLGHVTEAYGDATTMVAAITTSPGSDKMLVAHGEDVAMEGMAQPGATNCSWDTLGRVPEVPGDATSTVASVPVSPGTYGDATTMVAAVTTSSGGDEVLEATSGDVTMDGTEDPSATGDPRDTFGHVTEAYADATTMVASVPVSSGGDRVLVATSARSEATGDPRDTLGHGTEAYGDATTTVAPVTTSSGGDKVLVATSGDVTVEGTEDPSVTSDPRDTLGRVTEAYGDATTMVASVPVSPASDKMLVAHGEDVAMEGTAQP
ncbi:hypothetical protein DV515_00019374, partial [Chloebia gouldiae]